MNLEGLLAQQVVDAVRPAGLGPGVVGGEPPARGQPDRVFIIDRFGRVPVVQHGEDSPSVFKLALVQDGCSWMVLFGNGPLELPVFNPVPVETGVDRRETTELVEDIAGGFVFEAFDSQPPGDLADDPPVGLRLPVRCDRRPQALHPALGVGAGSIGLSEARRREYDVGQLAGLCEEEIDHHQVVEALERVLAVIAVRV